MKNPPTLIDTIYGMTFKKQNHGWQDIALRNALSTARRFVLDDKMSAFMADLSTVAFTVKSATKRKNLIEQMRASARLPHANMWLEYNLQAERKRSNELLNRPSPSEDVPEQEGWLLQQHPQIETAFMASLFLHAKRIREDGYDTWVFPFSYVWTVDDSPLPYKHMLTGGLPARYNNGTVIDDFPVSSLVTGLMGYATDKVNVILSPYITDLAGTDANNHRMLALLQEWGGVVRRMWALLATINDIPVIAKDVTASKGFVAQGRYRKFLNHTIITLNIPEKKDKHKVARQLIALARRRAHQVRGHFRKDYRHPGERLWVKEHVRGDASKGFVTHSYVVKHENPNA